MKKILSIVLVICLCFAIVACGSGDAQTVKKVKDFEITTDILPPFQTATFIGTLIDDVPEGKGLIMFESFGCCYGNFVNGLLEGEGFILANGSIDAVFKGGQIASVSIYATP